MYPDTTAKEREAIAAREYGAIFIMGIGGELSNGEAHDGRAPDYDDWDLNGDLVFWHEPLGIALELLSMGIRVDSKTMLSQLKISNREERLKYQFHQQVVDDSLPLTIGGGIGQSRICMFFLRKAHIGEVQCSLWPKDVMDETAKKGLQLL